MTDRNRHVARTVEALRKSTGMAGSESVRIVALGDSVTAGWLEHGVLDPEAAYPNLFRRRLNALFPHAMINVLNMGLGGEDSEGVLTRLERDCLRHSPHLVTICLGLNDARNGREYVPTFRTNLTEIVDRIRTTPADLLLITPNTRGDALQEDGTLVEFVRAIRAVSRAQDVGLVDVHAVYQGAIRMGAAPADLMSNRVSHPTREGHHLFANALIAFFQP
ncbi:MAG: GDSL-type esterase/lipase family protein [Capsulimonadales bacterium]|nr:GDSL-type esterase/lipase family protein [Capsulimonadales bacterium]